MKGLKIFSEAGYETGFGHFTRMSGICERAVEDGYPVQLFLKADEVAEGLLARPYVSFEDWASAGAVSRMIGSDDVAVVDSYNVDISFLEGLKDLSGELIVIDDNIRLDYRQMTVINPNYFGEYLDYPADCGNEYHTGKDCTLMRRAFYREFERGVNDSVEQILITMGGSDALGLTDEVIDMVRSIDRDVKLNVVATGAYRNLDAIRARLSSADDLFLDIDAEKMRLLMMTSDFAIASGGGVSNELIKCQCPALLVETADNQRLNIEYLHEHGIIDRLVRHETDKIRDMFPYAKRAAFADKLKEKSSGKSGVDVVLRKLGGEE